MKKNEKLKYLIENHQKEFVETRRQIFEDLSDHQTMFCVCGRLATGLHERYCKKFNDKVNSETIKALLHLIPKQ